MSRLKSNVRVLVISVIGFNYFRVAKVERKPQTVVLVSAFFVLTTDLAGGLTGLCDIISIFASE
jgi:hypothetical protein